MDNDRPGSILVVDDSQSVQKMLREMLEQNGYSVTCASSGEEALQTLPKSSYDLVLTDIIMPAMSGLTLLKIIKETKPDTEVIVITSNASSYTAIKALRLGAYDFIIKPIDDMTILGNIIARALEKKRLTIENRRLIDDLSVKNRELEEAVDMMKTVNWLCGAITSTLETGEILKTLVDSAVQQLSARKGYLLLLDKPGKYFAMKVSIGIDRELSKNFRMGGDQGISGLVASNSKAINLGNDVPPYLTARVIEEDPAGELFTSPGLLSVPLRMKDRVVGVVNVSGRSNGNPFNDTEVEFLATLANHAAIALDNAGAIYRLKRSENRTDL